MREEEKSKIASGGGHLYTEVQISSYPFLWTDSFSLSNCLFCYFVFWLTLQKCSAWHWGAFLHLIKCKHFALLQFNSLVLLNFNFNAKLLGIFGFLVDLDLRILGLRVLKSRIESLEFRFFHSFVIKVLDFRLKL